MKATLRRTNAADLDEILRIQHACPEAAQWPATEWRKFLLFPEGPSRTTPAAGRAWVAESSETVVGFLAGLFLGEEMEILNLAVSPEARRMGVASQLLNVALDFALHDGGKRAFLEVRASNAGAIAFYEGHGFRTTGRRREYYAAPAEDALLLARPLRADDSVPRSTP
ncbi:MAG: ribosomal protein S18-alanine N-acetyltransferase [Acidobacteria bacterium]|nr:ribosomal protein S18-alanine N-acetyltransferase [Acidobacteriota bacterium]MCL5286409.1 ribosomal protein S18-alanine N-acetyltransferase [Acidobacteriota bacterium]